jgi:mono/diheme cytochrome c family protein
MRSAWAGIGSAGLIAAIVAACATSPAATGTGGAGAPSPAVGAPATNLPPGVTTAMVQSGRQLYTSTGQCSNCHGDDGRGTMLGPNLTDREWLNGDGSYDSIVTVINAGVPQPKAHSQPMLPKGGSNMTADQVRAVAAYVYTLSPR